MELRKPPQEEEAEEEPQQPDANLQPPAINLPEEEQKTLDFGPPKVHSIVEEEANEQTDASEEVIPDSPLPSFPPQFPPIPQIFSAKHPNPPSFLPADFPPPPPPPPHIRPEGRSGIIPEINPDSEMVSTEINVHKIIEVQPPNPTVEEIEEPSVPAENERHVVVLN